MSYRYYSVLKAVSIRRNKGNTSINGSNIFFFNFFHTHQLKLISLNNNKLYCYLCSGEKTTTDNWNHYCTILVHTGDEAWILYGINLKKKLKILIVLQCKLNFILFYNILDISSIKLKITTHVNVLMIYTSHMAN